jgi:hypothetical protein
MKVCNRCGLIWQSDVGLCGRCGYAPTAPSSVQSTALLAASRLIEDVTGSCPADCKNWQHPQDCGKTCTRGCEVDCWVMYFAQVAANAADNQL